MKYPSVWSLCELVDYVNRRESSAEIKPGMWVPARPLGFASFFSRCQKAWWVFTGRCDALEWPGQ